MELYATNGTLTIEEERQTSQPLPDPKILLTPTQFAAYLDEKIQFAATPRPETYSFWQKEGLLATPEGLTALLSRVEEGTRLLKAAEPYQWSALAAGKQTEAEHGVWDTLFSLTQQVSKIKAESAEGLLQYAPTVSETVMQNPDAALGHAEAIGEHLKSGSLNGITLLFRPAWRDFLKQVTVNGRPPKTADEFAALRAFIDLSQKRQALCERWRRQCPELAPPPPSQTDTPEEYFREFVPRLKESLLWYCHVWQPLEAELNNAGIDWTGLYESVPPDAERFGDLRRLQKSVLLLPSLFAYRIRQMRVAEIDREVAQTIQSLDVCRIDETGPIVALSNALQKNNATEYRHAYENLTRLFHLQQQTHLRHTLLKRLETVAPTWAASLRHRSGIHAADVPPGAVAPAWQWRQLAEELDRRARVSPDDLQKSLRALNTELQKVTAELIQQRAWAAQAKRTTLTHRQSLYGWLQIVQRLGKGTGKRAPQLRVEAQKSMIAAQSAVPVWIMPLSQVVTNFDPETTYFDVVIIDEASQLDALGLIALFIGKSVVIVGDDKQVSPGAIGDPVEEVQQLIDERLQGIPNAILYDGQQSIYDIANRAFGGVIALREHFRCVPEIIQFSNHLCYEGKITPLRDASSVKRLPAVVEYRVEGRRETEKINETEAQTIVSLIVAAIQEPEYKDGSFGVVSLVGDEQVRRIDTLLREYLSPLDYERHHLLCGTAAQFQGDERDVMFLSVVDATGGGPLPLRADDNRMFQQRFNVAASRARDQMWVIHSLNVVTDLKSGDIRRRLIEFAQNPNDVENRIVVATQDAESDFEKRVIEHLLRANYRVIPQYKVGAYRIDIVVEGNGKRLAVECDGDRYHTTDKLQGDMQRQAILERLGWEFVRIRGTHFYRNEQDALRPLFVRLQEREIKPETAPTPNFSPSLTELKDRIVRAAAQWRRDKGMLA